MRGISLKEMEAQHSDVPHNKSLSNHKDKSKWFFLSIPYFSHKAAFSFLIEFALNICKITRILL